MDNSFEENLKKGRLFIIRLEELQYSYFNDRPEWITIHMNDLKLFIASFYYERPSSNVIDNNKYSDMDNTEILFKLYNNEIQENILNMKKIIQMKIEPDSYGNIDVGVTMTHSICKKKCDICQNFPDKDIHKWLLLRIKSIKSKCIFIDYEHNRTYSNWEEYLENNNLPNGFMFYPYSGFYDPSKTLYQNITPASKKIEKILKVADIASKILDWAGCIIVAASWVFPIAVPVLLPTLAVCTSSSIYGAGRQINQLIDMYKYDNKVSVTRAAYEWIDLAISVIGAITTPAHIFTAVTTEISSIQKTRSFLTIFRKSAYVTQCTLEVFRFTLELIDNNFEVTLENVLNLRLDLFLITGILMASSDVKNILNVLFQKAVWLPIYKTMEKIPYCMAPILWQSVYFIKNHLAVFVERVIMFLTDNLTPENLLTAWKNIRLIFDNYQKQTTQLGVVELLRHVVENIAEQESVKYVLRGERMVKLLESLREVAVNRSIRLALVKYCVERVLQEAKKLSAMHNDCVAELARLGETNVCEVDKMFCKIHKLERCAMDQYALWAIGKVGKIPPVALMAEYQEHASRPENMFDDEMVVKETVGASRSVKGYTFLAPCSVLDLELCLQFAEKVNPQHHYISHEFVQPEAGVSILLKVSAFSVNIIFFGVDLINGVPKMSICFFQENRDSTSSIENCKGLKKLLKAP